jgi:hypothetical protein
LKCTIEGALEEIEKKCGLVGFIMIGGPDPKCGGDLMVMSCVLFTLLVLRQQFLIISRAHTGTNTLGLNFSQAYNGWGTQIEEPFLAYLNSVFSASPPFFYMLAPINSYPAQDMRQALSLPGTASMQDSPRPYTPATNQSDQLYSHVRSNATEFVGTPPDIVRNESVNIQKIYRMVTDKTLHCFGDSDSESEV